MTRDEQLQAIRQKCVKANPAIETRPLAKGCRIECTYDWTQSGAGTITVFDSVIRLADVLLTMRKSDGSLWDKWTVMKVVDEYWALQGDSLDEQSEECLTLLYDLLCGQA